MDFWKKSLLFLGLLSAGFAVPALSGQDRTPALEFHDAGGLDSGEEPDLMLAELAAAFRRHCVQVYIYGKSFEGALPAVGNFAADIRSERPTPVGGYWWDDRHVIIQDPMVNDDFIRRIEIRLPYSDVPYQARIAGRFIKLEAVLLEVLPGEGGVMPQSFPLEFVDGEIENSLVLSYGLNLGDWSITADTGLGKSSLSDEGLETISLTAGGVFVSEQGLALGLAFGKQLILDEDQPYWFGRELPYTPIYSRDDSRRQRTALGAKLEEAVLEVRFGLRIKVDDDEDDRAEWMFAIDDGPGRTAQAEIRTAGLVVGEHHLFVPLNLPPEGIARIDTITVVDARGKEMSAEFAGALREYMAVILQTEAALPAKSLPRGFTLLNPLVMPDDAFTPDGEEIHYPMMEYIQRWRVDYSPGRRRVRTDYDRWLGTFPGFRGDPVVSTFTDEEDGTMAFDTEGNLVAFSVTPRTVSSPARTMYSRNTPSPVRPSFRPVNFLSQRLHAADAFDPAIRPAAEDDGQRLADFGTEFQGLDANTARLFSASAETRGGRIGLLVTHVYPGFAAEKAGIREHDILLRFFVEGKSEPMELRTSGFARGYPDFIDLSVQNFQAMMQFMPPPWPSREDSLAVLLTAAGIGKKVTVEYLREGELQRGEFVTEYAEPDYRSARRERFPRLGLTVKPVTYEVQRYFRLPGASGVIVSKVEEGGKSSVAGLHQYLLVSRVNGEPVRNAGDFSRLTAPFESGKEQAVELTAEGFGKTRLVKIE